MTEPRSYLYVPGDRAEMLDGAFDRGADAVIVDLEDAVSEDRKPLARDLVADWLTASPAVPVWIRIDADHRAADLDMISSGPGQFTSGVCVPKVAEATTLDDIGYPVMALIETAAGWLAAADIGRHHLTRLLACGEADLAADLGMDPSTDDAEMLPFRMHMIAASRACGLPGPVGPVHVDLGDAVGLERSTDSLRRMGFRSRAVVHPTQIDPVNRIMSPTDEELHWAERVLTRSMDAGAYRDDDGRLVDEAMLRRARALMARAGGRSPSEITDRS